MSFDITFSKAQEVCLHNCGVRINAAITAIVPVLAGLQQQFPSFHDYLPASLYGYGFVALGILNIILHARNPVKPAEPADGTVTQD